MIFDLVILKNYASTSLTFPFPYDQQVWGSVGKLGFLGGGGKHYSFIAPNCHVISPNSHMQFFATYCLLTSMHSLFFQLVCITS